MWGADGEQKAVIRDSIVVTGVGMVTSLGLDRESTWSAVQRGERRIGPLVGYPGLPDGAFIGAEVPLESTPKGRLKVMPMCELAADEAVSDARIDWSSVDRERFGCSLNAHMGDCSWTYGSIGIQGPPSEVDWWTQWFPNTTCYSIADRYDLRGPRLSHSTACASGLISILCAMRSLQDRQCDIALAGGGDMIDSLFAAGFQKMRVLAEGPDPATACRPYDRHRNGFVMGEGAAILVLERLSHALRRGARIYAEILAGQMFAEAHHVTGLDAESDSLCHLIDATLRRADIGPEDVGYVNSHGTGTTQNDLAEMRAIHRIFGPRTNDLFVSSTKSMLGHMVNAAGCVELAITLLALRDGFAPPTMNVTDPDPECRFDCLPLAGKSRRFEYAIKLSIAFGGHLVGVALRRWNHAATGFAYPPQNLPRAA